MPCMLARDGVDHVCRCEEYRFFSKVQESASGCWEWVASIHKKSGYGKFGLTPDAQGNHKTTTTHVWAWEFFYGDRYRDLGLVIDHICKNLRCCNPLHLDLVTQAENLRRSSSVSVLNSAKMVCPQGHPYTTENTQVEKDGARKCRTCRRKRDNDRYHNVTKRRVRS